MTPEQRRQHPWWGVECPSCGAAPGEPCKGDPSYTRIHGQRTAAPLGEWSHTGKPRPSAKHRGQLALDL